MMLTFGEVGHGHLLLGEHDVDVDGDRHQITSFSLALHLRRLGVASIVERRSFRSVTRATCPSCQQSGRRSAQLTESKRTDRSNT
ncbi:hypothetical protein ABZ783_29325 [Micromonospora sp. NPDC047738]|uniref:hypothetical protein n=1 Tax=Micromonospora sp. NPDC047738 TaxID=3155741 RepID=UPI0033F68EC2